LVSMEDTNYTVVITHGALVYPGNHITWRPVHVEIRNSAEGYQLIAGIYDTGTWWNADTFGKDSRERLTVDALEAAAPEAAVKQLLYYIGTELTQH
jgi:hypothetical protein